MIQNILREDRASLAQVAMISESGIRPPFLLGENGWMFGEESVFLSLGDLAISRLPPVSAIVIELSLITWCQFDFIAHKIKNEIPDSWIILVSSHGEAIVHCVAEYARSIGLRVFGRGGAWLESFSDGSVATSQSLLKEYRNEVNCSLRESLMQALDERAIAFSYQPKLSLVAESEANVLGCEQLVSSLGGELNSLPLSFALDELRACGCLGELVWLGVSQALNDYSVLRTFAGQCCLSKNWPVEMTLVPSSSERLINKVDSFGISRECICLELSEYDCYLSSIQSIKSIISLRLSGFKLALDDFGIKNSNLLALSFLPISELKIDRALTSQVVSWPRAAAVTDMAISLCQSLDIVVVAEGVETARELEWFKAAGCDAVQGHFYAPKMRLGEFRKWANSVVGRGLADFSQGQETGS